MSKTYIFIISMIVILITMLLFPVKPEAQEINYVERSAYIWVAGNLCKFYIKDDHVQKAYQTFKENPEAVNIEVSVIRFFGRTQYVHSLKTGKSDTESLAYALHMTCRMVAEKLTTDIISFKPIPKLEKSNSLHQ